MLTIIEKEDLIKTSKKLLSIQIRNMHEAGFGYLSSVIRTSLFECDEEFYKNKILPVFLKENPMVKVV